MLTLGIPVIGVTGVPRAVEFRASALDLVSDPEWESETWRTLGHADGSGRALGLLRSASPAEPHPRLHLDLFVETRAEQEAEVERPVAWGARRIDRDRYPPEPDFTLLADPTATLSAWWTSVMPRVEGPRRSVKDLTTSW